MKKDIHQFTNISTISSKKFVKLMANELEERFDKDQESIERIRRRYNEFSEIKKNWKKIWMNKEVSNVKAKYYK